MKRITLVSIVLAFVLAGLVAVPAEAQIQPLFGGQQTVAVPIKQTPIYMPQVYMYGRVSSLPNLSWEEQIQVFRKAKMEVFRENLDGTQDLVASTLNCKTQYAEGTPAGCVSDYGDFYLGYLPGAKSYVVRVFMPGGFADVSVKPQNGQVDLQVNPVEIGLKGTAQVLKVSKTVATVVYSIRNESSYSWTVNIDADLVIGASTASKAVIPCQGVDCSWKNVTIPVGGEYSWIKRWDLNQISELDYIQKGSDVQVRLKVSNTRWRDLVWVDAMDEFQNTRGAYWQPTQTQK